MSEEPTDAAAPAPTRRSTQAARPVPPPLPPTEAVEVPKLPAIVPPHATRPESVSATAETLATAAPDAASDRAPSIDDQVATIGLAPESVPESASTSDAELAWAPPRPRRPPALAGWALAVAVIGLVVSLVVGWGFPVGIIAIITAIAALRRPGSRRQAAAWALALGILSILYSALWIAVALNSGPLF